MRRSHQEIEELIAARVTDYVNRDASEDVLLASLKALGVDKEDRKLILWKAQKERLCTHRTLS